MKGIGTAWVALAALCSPALGRTGEAPSPPVLISKVPPRYPELPLALLLDARVIVRAVITTDGIVEYVETLACSVEKTSKSKASFSDDHRPKRKKKLSEEHCPVFIESAIRAVRQWRYEPVRHAGRPVKVYFTVKVDFELP